MKEIKEEAKRHHEVKLHKYGADHKACGGSMKKYAHGGHVKHDDEPEDKALIKKEVKSECLKHRDMGGPIAGGAGPKLGRGRKGGKGKGTNVNIAIGKPGGDNPAPIPPALGAGPSGPLPMAPKPAAPVIPPRPMPPAGPMKHGGKVDHKKHEKKHEHKRHEHRHHGHRGH